MSYIYIYIYVCVCVCVCDISSLRFNQLLFCVSLKMYNKFANYFCELKFSGNTQQRPLVVLDGVIPLETFPLVEWH